MAAQKGNKYAQGNPGGGRKNSFKAEYVNIAYQVALLGATDEEIAKVFDVSETTINNWKKQFEEFSVALKKGKMLADAVVADKLYQRATGYQHPDTDIKMFEGQIIKTEVIKHYPPDTTAAIFWLKNRQRGKWRDRVETEITGKDGGPIDFKNANLVDISTEQLHEYLNTRNKG